MVNQSMVLDDDGYIRLTSCPKDDHNSSHGIACKWMYQSFRMITSKSSENGYIRTKAL